MSERPLTVAVTGLNATDNPGPGVAVIRALRDADPAIRIIGLAYDALDPGTVSYTHLDVYKRQPVHRSSRIHQTNP